MTLKENHPPYPHGVIAFCNSTLAWGGGEKWHLEASLGLARLGNKVILLAHPKGALYARAKENNTENFLLLPIEIHRLSFLNPFKLIEISNLLRKHQVESIILNLPQDLKAAGLAAKRAGVKSILYRRGSAIPVKNSFSNRYLYGKLIDKLIANSQATKNTVLFHNPDLIDQKKIHILSNGIDTKLFDMQMKKAHPRYRQGKEDKLIIGSAGRLNHQKAQHLLIYLGHELKKRKLNFHIIIAGTGEREEELKKLSSSLDLDKEISFIGFLEDLSPFWHSLDIFILTSLWEGFGYVLLEAMLAGKGILAFDISNIPELVKNGENGLLFPLPENADLLDKDGPQPDMSLMADALESLNNDKEKMKKMGSAGRAFALPRFSQEKSLETLLEIILQ